MFDVFAILILSRCFQNKVLFIYQSADKMKNTYIQKNQQKLKNQHAGNRPYVTKSNLLC